MSLYNQDALARIAHVYPELAKGVESLVRSADHHEAGSAEIVLRYDKPDDPELGKYEIMLTMRVQERSETS